MGLRGLHQPCPYRIVVLFARGGTREGQVCEVTERHGLEHRMIDQVGLKDRISREKPIEKLREEGHGNVLRLEWPEDAPTRRLALFLK